MKCYIFTEKELPGHICKCDGTSNILLYLVVNAKIVSVCRNCAVGNNYYCDKHECVTHDLDDGKICPQCVSNLAEREYNQVIIRRVYQLMKRILSVDQLKLLPSWVQLACGIEPRSISHAIWWIFQAKVLRSGLELQIVIDEFKTNRSLSYLIPFNDSISPQDLLELKAFIFGQALHDEPILFTEAKWRFAIAELKRKKVTINDIAHEFSSAKIAN